MDNLEQEHETPEEDNSQQDEDLGADDGLVKRYKDQVNGSKKEAERLRKMVIDNEAEKASQDAGNLVALYNKDPKLANEVAKRFGYSDFEDAKSAIEGGNSGDELDEKPASKGLTEDEFEKRYQKQRKKEVHLESLGIAESMLNKLEGEVQEKAKKYFDKIVGNKTLDRETATEFAEMATLYVNKDEIKKGQFNDGLKQFSTTGLSQGRGTPTGKSKEEGTTVVRDGRLVFIPKKTK